MAKIIRIEGANYNGMYVPKWPDIDQEDKALYDRLCAKIVSSDWMSQRERAEAHRLVHYLLERGK